MHAAILCLLMAWPLQRFDTFSLICRSISLRTIIHNVQRDSVSLSLRVCTFQHPAIALLLYIAARYTVNVSWDMEFVTQTLFQGPMEAMVLVMHLQTHAMQTMQFVILMGP